MKEVEIKDLCKYIDPLSVKADPAIAIAADGETTNGLTIGWAQFGVLWRKMCATVYVHEKRWSKHIFDKAEYFSICFMKPEDKPVVDYFGTVSGKDENKMEKCGLTVVSSDFAPYFAESRVTVLCRIMGKQPFDLNEVDAGVYDWYSRDGVHTQYYGEIVKVLVSE